MSDKQPKEITVKIDSSTVFRVLYIVLAGLLLFSLLDKILQPLILIVISFFLAIGLNPAVSWIAKKLPSGSRSMATGFAYFVVVGFLTLFFAVVFPPIIRQTVDFLKEVPETIQEVRNENQAVKDFIQRYEIEDQVDNFTNDLRSRVGDLGKPALSAAGKVGETLANVVIVFVLTFMMLVEGPKWFNKYIKTLKPDKRERHKMLAKKMNKVIVGYVNGQVFIAALGGFFATVSLVIASQILNVGVNYIALGGIVALFALLPLIGTTIGAIIVVLSCLIVSLPLAIIMTIYFIIYQQIENVTIQPYIQSKSSSMTPLMVIIAALIGVALSGLVGALLAIPAAGCLKVIVDDYYHRKLKQPD